MQRFVYCEFRLAYKAKRDARSEAALAELAKQAQEMAME